MSNDSNTSWVSEIYEGFFLRDLLSFVIPGLITILGIICVVPYDFCGNNPAKTSCASMGFLFSFKEVSGFAAFCLSLVIFGTAYIVGFVIQEIGIKLNIISHFNKNIIKSILYKKYKNQKPTWPEILCEHYYLVQSFNGLSDEYQRKINERNIVLRQMIGNTCAALFVIFLFKIFYVWIYFGLENINGQGLFFLILFLLFWFILFFIHRELLLREFTWRLTTLKRGKFNDPILEEIGAILSKSIFTKAKLQKITGHNT